MAVLVATPLKKQFTRIAGVTEMTSSSSIGSAAVTLQFDLSRDINAAARDTQAAINAAAGFLPSMQSDVVPRPELYDIASSIFAQKLAQVQGVGRVGVGGSSLPAVRVELNPQPVSQYNVGLDQIGTFLAGANANSPKGSLGNNQITDQLFEAKNYKDLVVVYRDKAPVRLSDLGRVVDGNEDVRNPGLARGEPAVTIQVNRQPNANIIDTVDRIEALLPQFRASLPPTVHLDVDNDRTTTIRASVLDAQRNMVVVPVSLIGTFGAMYLLGYNLPSRVRARSDSPYFRSASLWLRSSSRFFR